MQQLPYNDVREYYKDVEPSILERNPPHRWVSPYGGIRWELYFSPIEEITWNIIRCFGKAPLYPQYPVLNYFVDFGNPKVKVALECDGKEWHKDKAKDYYRDGTIFNTSEWHIYRTSGSECYAVEKEYAYRGEYYDEDFLMILDKFYKTTEGVIKAIAIFYFGYEESYLWDKELHIAFKCLLKHASISQLREIEIHLQYMYGRLLNQHYENIAAENED